MENKVENHGCRQRVAVIGTGMAGLVTAWLLHRDSQQRYQVEVFECGKEASLDAASVSVLDHVTKQTERIDVPMRAFTEGYYHNLKAMYDFLNVDYQVQPFLFSFARSAARRNQQTPQESDELYYVHASNHHQLLPTRPSSVNLASYICELLFALLCYIWFTTCCLFIPAKSEETYGLCENFEEYLRRIKLPQYFIRYYLLPLMSAITTCPHRILLAFPAKDIVDYKRCITSGRQLTVSSGVNKVQDQLLHSLDVKYSTMVENIEPNSNGLTLRWRDLSTNDSVLNEERFDKVVFAVPPNVVGAIFKSLRKSLAAIPTISVHTIVHRDATKIPCLDELQRKRGKRACLDRNDSKTHVIYLKTTSGPDASTEATHVQPSGTMVTSCPLTDVQSTSIICSSTFTRVLRTPASRRIVNRIFGFCRTMPTDEKMSMWKNGDDGIFLVGSWCWDGMVLLEGCVVSAMRTAAAFDVDIPWVVRS